jgi:hypothetical protein
VAYTRADGATNTLHYVYSSRGLPTLLVARTGLKSNMTVDWKSFLSSNYSDVKNSVTFTQKPDYAYAVVFTKVSVLYLLVQILLNVFLFLAVRV